MILSDWIPLFAALDDWLQLLVPAVFVIIWVISQVAGGGGQKGRRPARGIGQPKQQNPGRGLSDQIEAFLNQVQGRKADQGQPPQPARAQPVQEARAARPQVLAESMPSDVVEAELVEPARRPVGQSAKPGRQRRPKRQSADRSGGRRQRQTDVDQADDKMAAHMHQVFDHDIGSLHDTSDAIHEETDTETTDKVPEVPGTVEAIRQMLAGPESARKAIILSEILARPRRP